MLQVMKLNSVKDRFEISKRHFYPYDIVSKCVLERENIMLNLKRHARTILQTCWFNWSHLLNHRKKLNSVKYPFEIMEISFKWAIVYPLKLHVESVEIVQSFLYARPKYGETCVTSNDHIWQTKKRNEILWNTHLR